jgi:hypothetical protein
VPHSPQMQCGHLSKLLSKKVSFNFLGSWGLGSDRD